MKVPAATCLLPFFLPFEVVAQEPTGAPSISKVPTAVMMGSDVPSGVPSSLPPTPEPECISSSTVLRDKIFSKDPFVFEEYILCPNTVVDVGFPDSEGVCCTGGDPPIYLRSNTLVKCGVDGSVENNCVFRGGQYQLVSSVAFFFVPVENFKVQGVTFEAGDSASIIIAINGDITIEDCMIKDHENSGAVITLQWPDFRRSRHRMLQSEFGSMTFDERIAYTMRQLNAWEAGETSIFEEGYMLDYPLMESDTEYFEETSRMGGRELQAPTRMTLTFRNTTFSNNRMGPSDSFTTNRGVVSAKGTRVDFVFEECLFEKNVFNDSPVGYAMDINNDNSITIIDSSFVDNDFLGNGAILFNSTGEVCLMNNYGTQDNGLTCQFFADETDGVECTPYDADMCALDPTMPPTMSPTSAPTAESGVNKLTISSLVATLGGILAVVAFV